LWTFATNELAIDIAVTGGETFRERNVERSGTLSLYCSAAEHRDVNVEG
jgi:hypothetical protein